MRYLQRVRFEPADPKRHDPETLGGVLLRRLAQQLHPEADPDRGLPIEDRLAELRGRRAVVDGSVRDRHATEPSLELVLPEERVESDEDDLRAEALVLDLGKRGVPRDDVDEPATGLHLADIRQLLEVLERLRDKGNTILVIEHNLDVIKTSDWVIDMGPEGGAGGGTVVAQGTPEDVANTPESYTGKFLAEILEG